MRLKDIADTRSDVLNISLDRISIDPDFNVRHDTPEVAAHIEWLRDSILGQGFLRTRPLTVRLVDGGAIVVDGHCRFAAVKLAVAGGADIRTLPCLPEGRGISPENRTLMLLTANSGLPLSALEQADAVARLVSYGWTENEIGKKIGRTRQHVVNLLELAQAPKGVRVMVVQGTVSATQAVKTVRAEGAAKAVKTLQRAAEHAKQEGRTRVTNRTIMATTGSFTTNAVVKPEPVSDAWVRRVVVPLQTAAEHVVAMAKNVVLPDDLDRAIKALADSLS